jgi:poly-gamma-glutamate synthesis protein (capsule biosynthesis protein)
VDRREWLVLSGATLLAGAARITAPRAQGSSSHPARSAVRSLPSDGTGKQDVYGSSGTDEITLFLCGDVMLGRGIDQILPHPSDPSLDEPVVSDAREYVELAEQANGPIPTSAGFGYVWGDALAELDDAGPDLRIVNLETAVTTADTRAPKGINYRMHPGNVPCLAAAGIDGCVLANNHVLDWGRAGLLETLDTLRGAGIRTAGAGPDLQTAQNPASFDLGGRRVLVFSFGAASSGVPRAWAATDERPGVSFLSDVSQSSAEELASLVQRYRAPGDTVVVSIHWGGNWGYRVSRAERRFAHRLVESGVVDVLHGHSSHHPRGIEVYRGRPILYGCGDFLNDYEGISGYEEYRDDLTLMYFVTMSAGRLSRLRMVPMRIRRFCLERASSTDAAWLQRTLDRESRVFGTRVELLDRSLEVRERADQPGDAGATR